MPQSLPNREPRKDMCPAAPVAPTASQPICRSGELLRGGRLYIQHGADTYCLRLTKSGKLLLTK